MKAIAELEARMSTRLEELKEEKKKGKKIVGYTPTGYCPEEIILACGAIPLGYVFAGDSKTLTDVLQYASRWYDPFWLSQIWFYLGGHPYYDLVDFSVNAAGDQHVRNFAWLTEYFAQDRPLDYLGIPHTKQNGTKEYYLSGLIRVKKELEELTGQEITDARLKESIELCNKERGLFAEIRALRKEKSFAASGRDFIKLQHGSHLLDKNVMLGILEQYLKEAREAAPTSKGPRIFLTGTGLGLGDDKILTAVEKAGATLVFENFIECVRPRIGDVKTEGDLLDNIAQLFYTDCPAPGWHNPVDEYIDNLVGLIKEYKPDGVIWYHGLYRDSYKLLSYYTPDMIRQRTGLDTIVFETYYEATEVGPIELRVKSYVNLLKED